MHVNVRACVCGQHAGTRNVYLNTLAGMVSHALSYTEDLAREVSLVRIVGGQVEAVLTACWDWGRFFQCQNTAGSFWREIRHGDQVKVLFRHDWAFVWVLANPHLRRGLISKLLACSHATSIHSLAVCVVYDFSNKLLRCSYVLHTVHKKKRARACRFEV